VTFGTRTLAVSGAYGTVTRPDLESGGTGFDSSVPDVMGRTPRVCGDPRHGSRAGFESPAIHGGGVSGNGAHPRHRKMIDGGAGEL
jgi:hypothetical protein